jgi:hypothetical protein
VTVSTDRDDKADFSKYRTYALAPAPKGEALSPSSENALRDTLKNGMAARGVRETSRSTADISVVRHVFSKDKVSVQQYTDWGYGYGRGWPYHHGRYNVWYGAPVTYTDVRQYTEGTLVLDFVDNQTRKLVFRGVGQGTLGSPESNASKIRDAVTRITADYPGPPGS